VDPKYDTLNLDSLRQRVGLERLEATTGGPILTEH
jgi:hypothetical protein